MSKGQFEYDVFLSHASEDMEWCKTLAERLRSEDIKVWFDDSHLLGGDHVSIKIDEGIEKSERMVAVFSPAYFKKEWTRVEVFAGHHSDPLNQNRSIIPVLLGPCDIPATLQVFKYIDFKDPNLFEEKFLELLKALGVTPKRKTTASYDPANSYFYVPHRAKKDRVIGRDQDLLAVREQLTQGACTSIGHAASFEGLGGLGKTQLAVEYAHQYKDEYPNGVYWLAANQDIDAQLTRLAVDARWVGSLSGHKDKLDIALHRIKSHSDCLIVFDNVESLDQINDYLPDSEAHVLATSRVVLEGFQSIRPETLNPDQAVQMLTLESGRCPMDEEEKKALRAVAERLAGLPLALELAGANVGYYGTDWVKYKRLLDTGLKKALPQRRTWTKHEEDLFATLSVSGEVFSTQPLLLDVLNLLTWSGPGVMGTDLMANLLIKDKSELGMILDLGCEKLRLLNKAEGGERYGLNPLVREIRREEISLEEKRDWADAVCKRIGDWFESKRRDFADLAEFESEIDHLKAWLKNSESLDLKHASRLIWLQAYPPFHLGKYQESHDQVQEAKERYEKDGLDDKPLMGHLLNDLGSIVSLLGDYNLGLKYHKQALEIRRECFGETHSDIAMSLNNIGGVLSKRHNHEKSLEFNKKALVIFQECFGRTHPDVALSLNNTGGAYKGLGDYEKALKYFEKALKIRQECLGEKHPETALSLNSIGEVFFSSGRYERALVFYKQAFDIYHKCLGGKHPQIATPLNNIGIVHSQLNDTNQALKKYWQALEILRESLGEGHRYTIICYKNTIGVLLRLGRKFEAIKLLNQAMEKVSANNPSHKELKDIHQQTLRNQIDSGPNKTSRKKKNRSKRKRK